jgi:trimeric autotransporter adhesin
MKKTTYWRLCAVALAFLVAPLTVRSQSILSTVLGAPSDGDDALSATLNMPVSVLPGANGVVYAGLKNAHQVIAIDPDSKVRVVAGTGVPGYSGDGGQAKLATLDVPAGLAMDHAGNIYIADSGKNVVRRLTPDGVITTIAGTGRSGNSGDGGLATEATLNSPSALAFDNSGNLLIADTWNHTVRMIGPDGIISRVAGTGDDGYKGNDGPALSALLYNPSGLAVDTAGNIYIADTGNGWIRMVSPDGTISRFAGVDTYSTTRMFGQQDPTMAINATLTNPICLAFDAAGNLYFVEYGLPRVRRITPAGKISSYAGTGTAGSSGDAGLARFANLNAVGIAFDVNSNLLIADGVSNRVRIVTASDGIIETIAGNGLASYNPRGIAQKGDDVYFSDTASNRIRKVNVRTGEVAAVAGAGTASFSGDSGLAVYATFNAPRGLVFDKSGNLYVADAGNHRVRRIGTDGYIATVAGDGSAETDGTGAATAASLHEPVGVAVDDSGNLYISERLGHVIRKVGTDGYISTVAGTGTAGAPSSASGVATSQKLNQPQGILWTSNGLLIADSGNNLIRRLFADGNITTIAGTRTATYTGDGGPATSATLHTPTAVATDGGGNVYVTDSGNHAVRRIGTDGVIDTVAGDGTARYNGDGSPATAYSLNAPAAITGGSACTLYIGDTSNKRIRELQSAIDYTISSSPSGLMVRFDGQAAAAPLKVSALPGTQHTVDAPSPQAGSEGTRYVAPAAQAIAVTCGAPRIAMNLNFGTQYSLTVASSSGGSVTSADAWQDQGATVALKASPRAGYVFSGWEGDCTGVGTCTLVMNGPRSVKANFTAATLGSVHRMGGWTWRQPEQ